MKFRNLVYLISLFAFLINAKVIAQKKYRVKKIDSTEGSYLVYVKRGSEKVLIISPKDDFRTTNSRSLSNEIKVGKCYRFSLSKHGPEFVSLPPEMPTSLSIDSKEVWKKGDDFDVYTSKNLAGLYYLSDPKQFEKNIEKEN